MKEKPLSLRDIGTYSHDEVVDLFRADQVKLPPGVHAQFDGSAIRCIYNPVHDESLLHRLPIVGTIVDLVRFHKFPPAFDEN